MYLSLLNRQPLLTIVWDLHQPSSISLLEVFPRNIFQSQNYFLNLMFQNVTKLFHFNPTSKEPRWSIGKNI